MEGEKEEIIEGSRSSLNGEQIGAQAGIVQGRSLLSFLHRESWKCGGVESHYTSRIIFLFSSWCVFIGMA